MWGEFGDENFYVTQILRGQGYFTQYLYRIATNASHYYVSKEGEVIDGAERTVFEYVSWQNYRSELTSVIGTITAANIVGDMIASR